tara:strand:- start:60 stop:329 length:270 start_codon:yes stop_codon:yes gene_type:complete
MKTITQINKEIERSSYKIKCRVVDEVIDDLIPMISEKVEDWIKDKLYDISELEHINHIDSIMDIKDVMIEQCRVDIMNRITIFRDRSKT